MKKSAFLLVIFLIFTQAACRDKEPNKYQVTPSAPSAHREMSDEIPKLGLFSLHAATFYSEKNYYVLQDPATLGIFSQELDKSIDREINWIPAIEDGIRFSISDIDQYDSLTIVLSADFLQLSRPDGQKRCFSGDYRGLISLIENFKRNSVAVNFPH